MPGLPPCPRRGSPAEGCRRSPAAVWARGARLSPGRPPLISMRLASISSACTFLPPHSSRLTLPPPPGWAGQAPAAEPARKTSGREAPGAGGERAEEGGELGGREGGAGSSFKANPDRGAQRRGRSGGRGQSPGGDGGPAGRARPPATSAAVRAFSSPTLQHYGRVPAATGARPATATPRRRGAPRGEAREAASRSEGYRPPGSASLCLRTCWRPRIRWCGRLWRGAVLALLRTGNVPREKAVLPLAPCPESWQCRVSFPFRSGPANLASHPCELSLTPVRHKGS